MSTVHNENTQFVDSVTGELINNGYVYFGDPGVDPVLNPKDVYDNRQLTGAALANPQRTGSDGRLLNKVWVDGKYSMKVTDSAGTQKLLDLDRGEIAQAGNSILINSLGVNDVTATGSPTITTLTDNQTYIFSAPAANTGAMTLAIDAIAAKPIKKAHDAAIESGDIKADQKIVVVYNSADDWFEIQSNVLNSVFGGNIQVGGDILDANSNEILELTETASAVNHLSATNSITTAGPTLSAVGDDTDIDLNLAAKGTGVVKANTNEVITTAGGQTISGTLTTTAAVNGLNTKIVDIGNWNMSIADGGTNSFSVTHGIADASKIRSVLATIRADTGSFNYDLNFTNLGAFTNTGSQGVAWDPAGTTVVLSRYTGGHFDRNLFDSITGNNRGWITIQYTD